MKRSHLLAMVAGTAMTGLPLSALAFGFGAMKHEYPPPWGLYGPPPPPPYAAVAPQPPAAAQGQAAQHRPPYPAPPPYGIPPYARDIKGMWGSGPSMSFGHKFKHEPPPPPQWRFTKDWVYVSPYSEEAAAQPSRQPEDDNPWKRPPEK